MTLAIAPAQLKAQVALALFEADELRNTGGKMARGPRPGKPPGGMTGMSMKKRIGK